MKYLWAPWRMNYILGEKEKGCFFCRKLKERKDGENLILYRGRYLFVIMNRFPYNNGHVMIVPRRHCVDLEKLREKELRELCHLLKVTTRILKENLHPHGMNMGINLGKAGGAGVDHLHLHIVPRWSGDTNFMPVLGEAKIIPQYLEETYGLLYSAFMKRLRRKGPKGGQKK
jgi:ATP adenylyltransferase